MRKSHLLAGVDDDVVTLASHLQCGALTLVHVPAREGRSKFDKVIKDR